MSDIENDIFDDVKHSDSEDSTLDITKDKKLNKKHENEETDNESNDEAKDFIDNNEDDYDAEEEPKNKKKLIIDEIDEEPEIEPTEISEEMAEEIEKANKILKNKDNNLIIAKQNRRTSRHITLYELAAVIGTRATQIDKGSPVFVKVDDLVKSEDMAIREILEKKSPLSIKRKTVRGIEIWEINEMILPSSFNIE